MSRVALLGILLAVTACPGRSPTRRTPPASDRMATPRSGALVPGRHEVWSGEVKIVYHVAGNGPVCLVSPGGPGLEWRYLRMPLVERTLTLVYVEPVGSGASGRLADSAGYVKARHVADLETVRAALGVPRVVLLGHSYGGGVALRYALAHPDRLAGLIVYDASAVTDVAWKADVTANIAAFAAQPEYADAVAAWREDHPGPLTDEEYTEVIRRIMPFYFADYPGRRAELDPYIAGLRASWVATQGKEPADTPSDLRDALRVAERRVPTLVIAGRHDFLFGPKYAQLTADAIDGATAVILPNSGHLGHLEEPAAFAQAIAAFVNGADLAAPGRQAIAP